jgi:hypothetical protein
MLSLKKVPNVFHISFYLAVLFSLIPYLSVATSSFNGMNSLYDGKRISLHEKSPESAEEERGYGSRDSFLDTRRFSTISTANETHNPEAHDIRKAYSRKNFSQHTHLRTLRGRISRSEGNHILVCPVNPAGNLVKPCIRFRMGQRTRYVYDYFNPHEQTTGDLVEILYGPHGSELFAYSVKYLPQPNTQGSDANGTQLLRSSGCYSPYPETPEEVVRAALEVSYNVRTPGLALRKGDIPERIRYFHRWSGKYGLTCYPVVLSYKIISEQMLNNRYSFTVEYDQIGKMCGNALKALKRRKYHETFVVQKYGGFWQIENSENIPAISVESAIGMLEFLKRPHIKCVRIIEEEIKELSVFLPVASRSIVEGPTTMPASGMVSGGKPMGKTEINNSVGARPPIRQTKADPYYAHPAILKHLRGRVTLSLPKHLAVIPESTSSSSGRAKPKHFSAGLETHFYPYRRPRSGEVVDVYHELRNGEPFAYKVVVVSKLAPKRRGGTVKLSESSSDNNSPYPETPEEVIRTALETSYNVSNPGLAARKGDILERERYFHGVSGKLGKTCYPVVLSVTFSSQKQQDNQRLYTVEYNQIGRICCADFQLVKRRKYYDIFRVSKYDGKWKIETSGYVPAISVESGISILEFFKERNIKRVLVIEEEIEKLREFVPEVSR